MNWNKLFAKRTGEMKRTAVRELMKLTVSPDIISFAGGLPAPELFPLGAVRSALDKVLSHYGASSLQYGRTEGIGELRDWVAEDCRRRGMNVSRENVVITHGSQQGLDLLGRILFDRGDVAVVENPTYLALLSAWRPSQVRFSGVSGDACGLDVSELSRCGGAKALYVVPTFQNPSGITHSLPRRQALLRAACDMRMLVVEDDPYGELRYEGKPVESIYQLGGGESGNVIYVGSFSKVLAPGLRLGWVVAPEPVIEMMVRAKQAADLHTSTLTQYLALQLLREGILERHLPRLIDAYRSRRDCMLAALERWMPAGTEWTRPEGGMFLMVKLPPPHDAIELLARSVKRGVAFVPGADFYVRDVEKNSFRLNFSGVDERSIDLGIERLGKLLQQSSTEK